MAVLKCKMCGGELDLSGGGLVCECEYCGTKQTVPSNRDDDLLSLFDRATTLRRKCEFDKAEAIYEKIIENHPTESEAYWGLILCQYGIEYVEDPRTLKRIPTCHRTSFEAITADENYKLAVQYADAVQRSVYESDAKTIDAIQKRILAISSQEEPYDVFICYKETDESGKRTQDSVLANDIYYQLTNEGFKVFYAAITLEDKLGSEYEPIIFAALNSAQVMLVIGTKPQYFNAVWVKNEWSRYLKLMKKDRTKLLFPCFRDMDAYELPDEFSHLQAQDMSKIGFINDIVRGIKKVLKKDEPAIQTSPKQSVSLSKEKPDSPTANLVKRMLMFLEDGDFASASEYADKILDIDVECAEAYLGKLMVDLKVKTKDRLRGQSTPFNNNPNFKKAIRFGDDRLVDELHGIINEINTRNKDAIYEGALKLYNSSSSKDLYEAEKIFRSIPNHKNADEMAVKSLERAKLLVMEETYQRAIELSKHNNSSDCFEACEMFQGLKDYKDSYEKAGIAENKAHDLLEKEDAEAAERKKQQLIAEARRSELNKLNSAKSAALARVNALVKEKEATEKLIYSSSANDDKPRKVISSYAKSVSTMFIISLITFFIGAFTGVLMPLFMITLLINIILTVRLAKAMGESAIFEGIKCYFTLGICGYLLARKAKNKYNPALAKNEVETFKKNLQKIENELSEARHALSEIDTKLEAIKYR